MKRERRGWSQWALEPFISYARGSPTGSQTLARAHSDSLPAGQVTQGMITNRFAHMGSVRGFSMSGVARCSSKAMRDFPNPTRFSRSEEHTSELQSLTNLVCRLLLEKKKQKTTTNKTKQ